MKRKLIIIEDNGLTEFLKSNGFDLSKDKEGNIIVTEDIRQEIDDCIFRNPSANAKFAFDYGFSYIPETPEEKDYVKEIIKKYN